MTVFYVIVTVLLLIIVFLIVVGIFSPDAETKNNLEHETLEPSETHHHTDLKYFKPVPDRGGESAYGRNLRARPPSNLWFQIVGLDQSENWGKKIGAHQLNQMVKLFLDFLNQGSEGREKYKAVLTELEILNDMDTEVEHRAYANRLGFNQTIRPEHFEQLEYNLVIHINKSAADNTILSTIVKRIYKKIGLVTKKRQTRRQDG